MTLTQKLFMLGSTHFVAVSIGVSMEKRRTKGLIKLLYEELETKDKIIYHKHN